jgi:hypothetical protein
MQFNIAGSTMIHPPHLLPWLHFLTRMSLSETYVVLDTVAFRKHYFHNRTYIHHPKNGLIKVSLPVQNRSGLRSSLKTSQYCESNKQRKLYRTIKDAYGKSCRWPRFQSDLYRLINSGNLSLVSYNTNLLVFCLKALDLAIPKIVYASDIGDATNPTDRIISICEGVDATIVLSGWGGSASVHDIHKLESVGVRMLNLPKPATKLIPLSALAQVFHPDGISAACKLRNKYMEEYT